MRQLQIGKTTIDYMVREIPKSERLTINVTPGQVEVVVPRGTTDDIVQDFVHRKRHWIFEKVDEVEEAAAKRPSYHPTRFVSGAKIPYRGRMLKLTVNRVTSDGIQVEYKNGFIVTVPRDLPDPDAAIKSALESWMKARLEEDCRVFVARYAKKLGVTPKGVRVKDQKHLWGSCGKDHIININWHLAFAPKQVLEYVVAHEVCHLKHRNHTEQFWRLLGSVFGEVDFCKTWLEDNKTVWETDV